MVASESVIALPIHTSKEGAVIGATTGNGFTVMVYSFNKAIQPPVPVTATVTLSLSANEVVVYVFVLDRFVQKLRLKGNYNW